MKKASVPYGVVNQSRLLHEDLAAAAASNKHQDAVFCEFTDGPSFTFKELWSQVEVVVSNIRALGVCEGARLAIMLDNGPEFLLCWYGASAAGGIAVPLNTALRGDILTSQLSLAEPTVIVVAANLVHRVLDSTRDAGIVATIVVCGEPNQRKIDGAGESCPIVSWRELMVGTASASGVNQASSGRSAYDPCAIMFTSGTTGVSKGVVWTHRFHQLMGGATVDAMRLTDEDVVFITLPLFHANGLNVALGPALQARSKVVIAPRFSPTNYWGQIVAAKATVTNQLGSMTQMLMNLDPDPLEREHYLRYVQVIPCPAEYLEQIPRRYGFTPVEGYGMTDAGMVLYTPFGHAPKPGYCGRPIGIVECRVADSDDYEVPAGSVGELLIRPIEPYGLPSGYWRNSEATVSSWKNLWFHTGDLFVQDHDGWLRFVDRSKDAIRRRGENVSSYEVECQILKHPSVAECAVYGVPSDVLEEEVAAAVVLNAGATISEGELIDFIAPLLPYFAVPRFVTIKDSLPKTETEKIRKVELRGAGVGGAWDREQTGKRLER